MSTTDSDVEASNRLHALNQAVEVALREAGKEVIRNHKRLGLPLVTWQDGKVVSIPADQLIVDDGNLSPENR